MSDEEVVVPSLILAVPSAAAAVAVMRTGHEQEGIFEVTKEQLLTVDDALMLDLGHALIEEAHRLGCTIEWSYDAVREVFMFRWWHR